MRCMIGAEWPKGRAREMACRHPSGVTWTGGSVRTSMIFGGPLKTKEKEGLMSSEWKMLVSSLRTVKTESEGLHR
jgi:hypothetical protein